MDAYWRKWLPEFVDVWRIAKSRIERALNGGWGEMLTKTDVAELTAMHILMKPVFETLFGDDAFVGRENIVKYLEALRLECRRHGLITDDSYWMTEFYDSIPERLKEPAGSGVPEDDGGAAKQIYLNELYEGFAKMRSKKDSERLGIVTTPLPVVDFMLRSADDVQRKNFGMGLTDIGVPILDPCGGTGLYLARLLQSELLRDEDIEWKYEHELYMIEIVPIAYYIATVNIEETYRERVGKGKRVDAFRGIVLGDTFKMYAPPGQRRLL